MSLEKETFFRYCSAAQRAASLARLLRSSRFYRDTMPAQSPGRAVRKFLFLLGLVLFIINL